MFNQNRIYRVFQLINYLKAKPAKSVRSVMQFLDTSERTVYRYLDMLKDLGFKIERDSGNRIWITTNGNTDIVPFTDQEADYLEKLIKTTGKSNKLAESVLQKFVCPASCKLAQTFYSMLI
ncbi:MAG: HTH domain-containing protein [Bacteroidota bacterium]|jgi:proteasome accessory factor C